jgi:hypothetical protein
LLDRSWCARRDVVDIINYSTKDGTAHEFDALESWLSYRATSRKPTSSDQILEINPLECPKCNAQMRTVASIQDEHSIKDIMKAQGIPDFQARPPLPKFIDTTEAIDQLPSYDSFDPAPDEF